MNVHKIFLQKNKTRSHHDKQKSNAVQRFLKRLEYEMAGRKN